MILARRDANSVRQDRGRVCVPLFVAMCLILWAVNATAGVWRGKEETRDGKLTVMNPTEPSDKPSITEPKMLWELKGDEDDEFFFGVLASIATDNDGNVYLLDTQLNEVMVFSASGEYLRSIGREGEGPGEFRRPSDLFVTGDGNVAVVQRMPGKVVLMTRDGEPVGNLAVPEPDGGGMQMIAAGRSAVDHTVLQIQRFMRKETGFEVMRSVVAIKDGEMTAEFHSLTTPRNMANLQFNEKELRGLLWTTAEDGRVFVSDDFDAYNLAVWKLDGTLDRVVTREYEHRVRSEHERERSTPRVRIRRGGRTESPEVEVSETDRDLLEIYPRNDGSFWVLSSRGAFDTADGVIATFDVFDRSGRFTTQVSVKGVGSYADDGFHIVDNRLFVVVGLRSAQRAQAGQAPDENSETDAEPMRVICYDLSPLVQSKK